MFKRHLVQPVIMVKLVHFLGENPDVNILDHLTMVS